jgi:hypothetical protein
MKHAFTLLAACLLTAGCSTLNVDSDTEARAARHMVLADSLEEATAFDQATIEYRIVAELYPTSSAYQAAVRKTSLLYLNPDNPARNDSLAAHWLSIYLGLPVQRSERENARTQLNLLERVASLQHELAKRLDVSDSIAAVTRKQEAQISTQAQQLQALQNELRQVRQELDKLKQVDVQMNKSRRK